MQYWLILMENLEYKKEIVNFLTNIYSQKRVPVMIFRSNKVEFGMNRIATEFSSDFIPFNDFKLTFDSRQDTLSVMSITPWNLVPEGAICRMVLNTTSESEPSKTEKIKFTIVSTKLTEIYEPEEQLSVLTEKMEILNE